MFIDTHCHFSFSEFSGCHESIWQDCQRLGVRRLIIPSVNPDSFPDVKSLSERFDGVFFAVGLHPWFVAEFCEKYGDDASKVLESMLVQQAAHKSCVAIGEVGLDAMIDCSLDKQLPLLEVQLQLACRLGFPVILHQRKTHACIIALLKKYPSLVGGVMHGFSGSLQQAQDLWRLGFYLGVGGVITYARAVKTRKAIQSMPLESLLLETDAPGMPLLGLQGQVNSPVNIPLVAQALAELKGMSLDVIQSQMVINSGSLFKRLNVEEDCG